MSQIVEFEETRHRYTVDGRFVPSVTQVLEASGLICLDGIPPDTLRRAGQRGTDVHKAAALLMRGQLDWSTVEPEIGGYVRALDTFMRNTRFEPDPDSVETPLYCAQYDYCGTPDVVGKYLLPRYIKEPAKIYVVADWKTGMMSAVRFQLAAYAHMLGVRQRIAVKLNRDGSYASVWLPPETQRHDFERFLKALDDTRKDQRWAA